MSKTNENDSVLELLEDDNEVIDITMGWHEENDHVKMYNSNKCKYVVHS